MNRIILVAGMHRSGTSMLAQILDKLGGNLGDEVEREPSSSNRTGHWENSHVWRIHEALLVAFGQGWGAPSSPLPEGWRNWPEARAAVRDLATTARRNLIFADKWAVKDPRATRLLPLWLEVAEVVGAELRVVAGTRSPKSVASSLAKRNALSERDGQQMYLQYMSDLQGFAAIHPVLFVDYDHILARPRPIIEQIVAHCGLSPTADALGAAMAAIDQSLRHHVPTNSAAVELKPDDQPSRASEPEPTASVMVAGRGRIYLETVWNEPCFGNALRSVLGQLHTDWDLVVVADRSVFELVGTTIAPYRDLFGGRIALRSSDEADDIPSPPYAALVMTEFDTLAPIYLSKALGAMHQTDGAVVAAAGEWVWTQCVGAGPNAAHRTVMDLSQADALAVPLPCLVKWKDAQALASRTGDLRVGETVRLIRDAAAGGASLRLPATQIGRDARCMPPSMTEERVELVALPRLHIAHELEQRGEAIPLQPVPSTDIIRKDGFWLSTGPDPQLHFRSAERGVHLELPPGLYLLRFRGRFLGPQGTPHLYARARYDFSEARALRVSRGEGDSFTVLLNAPTGLNGLRLDPAEGVSSAMELSDVLLQRLSAALPTLHPVRTKARFPDVLCIGAQKSATTWLYHNLQNVPGVWRSPVKEFHHFDSLGQLPAFESIRQSTALRLMNEASDSLRMFGLALGFPSKHGWGNYLDLFSATKPDECVIDVTPAYATLSEAQVEEIARVMPHVKVLFILRDPVERSLTGAFHEARVRGKRADLATLASLAHEEGNRARSDYIATIERWSRHVPASSLKVMFYDNLLWDPASFLAEVCTFIGVPPPEGSATLKIPVNVGDPWQEHPSLFGLKAELSAQYLTQLDGLAGRYGSPCTQWKAAAQARLRSRLASREGAGAGEAASAPHTALNNLAQWNDIHPWLEDGDEWRGQADACGLDYEHWKTMIIARYRAVLQSEGTILEIGPGRGRFSVLLAELAPRMVLADIAPNCLDACRRRLTGRVALRTHLSSEADLPADLTSAVDAVWSFDCFVHLEPKTAFAYLAEIWRVLRPGGHAVIHHGDAVARARAGEPGKMAEGWRSPLTASGIADEARRIGFDLVVQEREWSTPERVGVPRFGDVISVLRRPEQASGLT